MIKLSKKFRSSRRGYVRVTLDLTHTRYAKIDDLLDQKPPLWSITLEDTRDQSLIRYHLAELVAGGFVVDLNTNRWPSVVFSNLPDAFRYYQKVTQWRAEAQTDWGEYYYKVVGL